MWNNRLNDLLYDMYGPIEIQAEGCPQYIIALEKRKTRWDSQSHRISQQLRERDPRGNAKKTRIPHRRTAEYALFRQWKRLLYPEQICSWYNSHSACVYRPLRRLPSARIAKAINATHTAAMGRLNDGMITNNNAITATTNAMMKVMFLGADKLNFIRKPPRLRIAMMLIHSKPTFWNHK